MSSGLEEADHAPLRDEDLAVVFYGGLFRKPGTRAGDIPRLTAADVEQGFEEELLTLWWRAAAELSEKSHRAGSDGRGEAPDIKGPDFQGRARTPRLVQRALRQLSKSRFFRALGPERALLFGLKQVQRYLT